MQHFERLLTLGLKGVAIARVVKKSSGKMAVEKGSGKNLRLCAIMDVVKVNMRYAVDSNTINGVLTLTQTRCAEMGFVASDLNGNRLSMDLRFHE